MGKMIKYRFGTVRICRIKGLLYVVSKGIEASEVVLKKWKGKLYAYNARISFLDKYICFKSKKKLWYLNRYTLSAIAILTWPITPLIVLYALVGSYIAGGKRYLTNSFNQTDAKYFNVVNMILLIASIVLLIIKW